MRKDLAMFLASEMVALNVPPDALSYDRLILLCLNVDIEGREEAFEDAWKYWEEMRGVGWRPRWGTAKKLAVRCCERGDEKVWRLVRDAEEVGGMEARGVERVVEQFWKGERRGEGSVETQAMEGR